jgi:hypothetical protein
MDANVRENPDVRGCVLSGGIQRPLTAPGASDGLWRAPHAKSTT